MVGLFVRINKIEYEPMANDADEMAYIFAGQSLYTFQTPISWSSLNLSETSLGKTSTQPKTVAFGEEMVALHRPWFDHPPLLPLIGGLISHTTRTAFLEIPPVYLYRIPMAVMAIGTVWLLFCVAKELTNEWAALGATAIAAFSPALILGQRMFVGDNFVAFFLAATLYVLIVEKNSSLLKLIAVSVLAITAKYTGVLVVAVAAFGLWNMGQRAKAVAFSVLSLGASAAVLGAYGWWFGGHTFITTFFAQSFRLLGWSNFSFVFSSPGFHNYLFWDFSYALILVLALTGFLSLDHESKNSSKDANTVKAAFILAFVLIWATAAETDHLGWYRLPLFASALPLVAMSLSRVSSWGLVSVGVLGLINNLGLVRYPEAPLPDTWTLRIVLLLGLALILGTLAYPAFISKKLKTAALCLVVVLYAGYAMYFSQYYFQAHCKDRNCPIPTITWPQAVKSLIL